MLSSWLCHEHGNFVGPFQMCIMPQFFCDYFGLNHIELKTQSSRILKLEMRIIPIIFLIIIINIYLRKKERKREKVLSTKDKV